MDTAELRTGSAAETERLGVELAKTLGPGDVVSIEGELGAGKSTLVRAACRHLGVDGVVTSPTFVLGRRYPLPQGGAVAHIDLYRLDDALLEEPALLAEYVGPDTVTFVEWPERGARELGIGTPRVTMQIAHAGGDERVVRIASDETLLTALEQAPR